MTKRFFTSLIRLVAVLIVTGRAIADNNRPAAFVKHPAPLPKLPRN